jgi:predicted RNA-binding protein with TRAM domain
MNKLYIFIAASMLMVNAYSVKAETAWEDNFDPIKTTWVETTAVWTDLAGSTAKLTENDSTLSYGFAQSEPITLDMSKYRELLISVPALDSGALYTVQIQEVGGAEAYANAISNMGVPCTKIIDIALLMGWSGTKTFVINIWIDGESKGVEFDTLQIRATETGLNAWSEEFNPVKTTWTQESCLWTDSAGIGAVLTENNPSVSYGVVRSETLTVDVNIYNELYVKTTAVDTGCYYTVQIQEIGGSGA